MVQPFQQRQTNFVCKHCGAFVSYEAPGTHNRNHCPYCLYSRHVDIARGDRRSKCGGMMKPVGVVKRKNGEELIVHQCRGCAFVSKNRIAGDDDEAEIEKLRENNVGVLLV
jgi:hypothetical protein